MNNIESIFLFCLIWSNLQFLSTSFENSKDRELSNLLELKIKSFRKVLEFKFDSSFGFNFFEIYERKENIFDLFYDINNEKWTLISDMKTHWNKFISKEYNSKNLMAEEIIRLNPKAMQLDEIQTKIENDKDSYVFLPHNEIYIETKHSKIYRYFLEYFISYDKNFLVVSTTQNGKNTIWQEIIRGKIEKNEMKNIKICLDKKTSIRDFQDCVERSYIKKSFNCMVPNSNKKCVLIIDDLNMCSNVEEAPNVLGCLRSLVENGGWFSSKKNKYILLNESHIASMFSFSANEEMKLFYDIEQINIVSG